MKKLIKRKDFPYMLLTAILGSLNHFLYEWTGENCVVALFCPISESTWEHLKLLFFPFLLFSVIFYYRMRPVLIKFLYSRLCGVLAGMLSIVMLFYTYTGVIGTHLLTLDILIFLFSVLVSYVLSSYLYTRPFPNLSFAVLISLWIFVILCFFFFTCFPPNIPLFFPVGTGYS